MNDSNPPSSPAQPPQPARNKGKLTGPKPPLRRGHVWSIRAKLQLERRTRDLALSYTAGALLAIVATTASLTVAQTDLLCPRCGARTCYI